MVPISVYTALGWTHSGDLSQYVTMVNMRWFTLIGHNGQHALISVHHNGQRALISVGHDGQCALAYGTEKVTEK